MSEHVNDGKRGFLKTAMLGAGASAIGAAAPGPVLAQMLETNIREDSVLAKIRKEGVINVGYAQTGPWFYKDARTGELGGIYKDVVDMLAKEIQIKVEWKEHPDTRQGGFPDGGRDKRQVATAPLAAPAVGPMGPQFNNKNPGKRGISLNVRHPKGREIALEFLRRSDVVAEGFSPGVFERWGFGWDVLQQINPTIIYAQQSGMGAAGAYGRLRAIGPTAAALSGLTHSGGLPEPDLWTRPIGTR